MSTDLLPEVLRRSISDDLKPVRPLPPAWMRTLQAAAVAAIGLALVIFVFKLSPRPDMEQLPMWLSWGCTALQLGIGVLLLGMALREAIPGQGVPIGAVALGLAVELVQTKWTLLFAVVSIVTLVDSCLMRYAYEIKRAVKGG